MKKSKLIPDFMFKKVSEIKPEFLRELGIKGMVVDIDNTLAFADHPNPHDGSEEWLKKMQDEGFKILLFSNNSKKRVSSFAKNLGLESISRALKPTKIGFKKASKALGIEMDKLAMVGDQIFTDVWGGNRAGLTTILVEPISPKTEGGAFFRLKRAGEKKYIGMYEAYEKK